MQDNEQHEARLWACAHGELSDTDRAELEAAVAEHADQKEAFQRIQALHQTLTRVAPLLDTSEDALADEILAAFDREAESADTTGETTVPPRAEVQRPLMLNPFARIGLAMAAGLLLFIGVTRGIGGSPLLWDDMTYQAPSYRGQTAVEVENSLSQQDARRMIVGFRDQVSTYYEAARPDAPRREWRLQVNVIALHEGAFMLELFANLREDPSIRVEWNESFVSAAAFLAAAESHAEDIADTLSAAVN